MKQVINHNKSCFVSILLPFSRYFQKNKPLNIFTLHCFIFLIYFAVYWLLKLPVKNLILSYYDDSETLYHSFNILEGKSPYKDDHSHHFLGYVLPFILVAKLVGFSPYLITFVSYLTQIFTSYFIFLICRLLNFKFFLSLLSGLLYISAREPWVLGFFQQYQLNFLFTLSWFLVLYSFKTEKSYYLYLSSLVSGLAFTWDQRALFTVINVFSSTILYFFLINRKSKNTYKKLIKLDSKLIKISFASAFFYILPSLLSLYYLYLNDAVTFFIEQTFIYPFKYRAGSKTFDKVFFDTLGIYSYLVYQTPLILIGGAIGTFLLIYKIFKKTFFEFNEETCSGIFLLSLMFPLSIIPALGGRNLDYYTIVWLPYLAILTSYAINLITRNDFVSNVFRFVAVTPIIFSFLAVGSNLPESYEGDGINETVQYIKENIKKDETIFVWGYRLDIYIKLQKLSAFPNVNQIMIHPDTEIKEEDDRIKHIDPKYENQFIRDLWKMPPTYIITFERVKKSDLSSRSNNEVSLIINEKYLKTFEVTKNDFTGKNCTFKVFKYK